LLYKKTLAITTPHVQTFTPQKGAIWYKNLTITTPHALYFAPQKGAIWHKNLTITTPHVQTLSYNKTYAKLLTHTTHNTGSIIKKPILQPKPVTCVTKVNATKPILHTYLYHGILMQCETPPEPGCFICFPLGTPKPPELFNYTADVLPENFIPPYVTEYGGHETPIISGGILFLNPIPGDPTGPSLTAKENSIGYFVNHMRYELAGPIFNPPIISGSPDEIVEQEFFFYSLINSLGYIAFHWGFWWTGGQWSKFEENYDIDTFVNHTLLTFAIPYQGFYIDLNYDPITDKTTADYNGLHIEELAGKITLYPAFYTASNTKFAAQQIDYEKITQE